MDKNRELLYYLLNCPAIANSSLYFNFINAGDNNKQIVTVANDKQSQTPYIDGSVDKTYSFTIIAFKSVSFNPIAKTFGIDNENVTDMLDVQGIIDWINVQNENKNFPNFGENCIISNISATTENPNLNSVDVSLTPALARYSITIQIDYLDITNKLWR